MKKVFGVSLFQKKEITVFCLGSRCGHGILSVINDDVVGALVPCMQAECPYRDKPDELFGQIWMGEECELYLRKLQN